MRDRRAECAASHRSTCSRIIKQPHSSALCFDLLTLNGQNVMDRPWRSAANSAKARDASSAEPIRFSETLDAPATDTRSCRSLGLEASLQTCRSTYAWRMPGNVGQFKVNSGPGIRDAFIPERRNFDAIRWGYYDEGRLNYAAVCEMVRSASREALFRSWGLHSETCPFVYLPEPGRGR